MRVLVLLALVTCAYAKFPDKSATAIEVPSECPSDYNITCEADPTATGEESQGRTICNNPICCEFQTTMNSNLGNLATPLKAVLCITEAECLAACGGYGPLNVTNAMACGGFTQAMIAAGTDPAEVPDCPWTTGFLIDECPNELPCFLGEVIGLVGPGFCASYNMESLQAMLSVDASFPVNPSSVTNCEGAMTSLLGDPASHAVPTAITSLLLVALAFLFR